MAAPRPKTQGSQTRCSQAATARTQVLRAGPTSAAHTGRLTNLMATDADRIGKAESITWGEELGAGSFGTVYSIECEGLTLAAKRLNVANNNASRRLRKDVEAMLSREFRALRKVNLPAARFDFHRLIFPWRRDAFQRRRC